MEIIWDNSFLVDVYKGVYKLNQNLKIRLLPAPTIIKQYVKHDNKCNYEYYLTEMLNLSCWMKKRHSCEFVWNPQQSNAECDAYSGTYGIDYKLIASKTTLQARSIFSPQISVDLNGVSVYYESKCSGEMKATRLFAAIRHLSLDELYRIRRSAKKAQGIDNDIKTFLITLEKNKNLLLFFPYVFSFIGESKPKDGAEIVAKALQEDFGNSFSYRSNVAKGYETYFVTIYYDSFLLMIITDNTIRLVDTIPTCDCPTYDHLQDYTWI